MSQPALFLSAIVVKPDKKKFENSSGTRNPHTHGRGRLRGDEYHFAPLFPTSVQFWSERDIAKRIAFLLLVSPLLNLLKWVRVRGSSGKEIEKPRVVLQRFGGGNIGVLSDSTDVCFS